MGTICRAASVRLHRLGRATHQGRVAKGRQQSENRYPLAPGRLHVVFTLWMHFRTLPAGQPATNFQAPQRLPRPERRGSSSTAGGGRRTRAAQGRLEQPHPVFRWVPIPYHSTVSRTFNSLFKVLCIFRSLYLFAIGLVPIFSLMRGIPHN